MNKIEDILLTKKRCTQEDIEQAYSIQREYGGQIGNILLNLGAISDTVYVEALVQLYGFKYYKDFQGELKTVNVKGVANDYFLNNDIFPIEQNENTISLATHNSLQGSTLITIENITGKSTVIYLATEEELRPIRGLYENSDEDEAEDIFEDEIDRLKELASEAPVIKLIFG